MANNKINPMYDSDFSDMAGKYADPSEYSKLKKKYEKEEPEKREQILSDITKKERKAYINRSGEYKAWVYGGNPRHKEHR